MREFLTNQAAYAAEIIGGGSAGFAAAQKQGIEVKGGFYA